MAKTTKKAAPGTMKKVLAYIGRYKLLLPISILLALFTVASSLYFPVLIGDAIDCIAPWGDDSGFARMHEIFLEALILIALTALAQWLMSTINNRIAYHVVRDIRNDAFGKIEELPLSSLDKKARGDTVNRVINDAERFGEGLLLGFTQVFTGVLTIVGALAFMLMTNVVITVAVVLITPLSIFVAKFIGSRTFNMFKERSECEAETTAHIDEVLGNQKLVKAFGMGERECESFDKLNGRLEVSARRAIFFSSLTNPTTRFVNSVVYAAVALIGALAVMTPVGGMSVITIGMYSRILAYSGQYTKPFNEISGIIAEFQNALASASRIFELIEEPAEESDADSKELTEVRGSVEIKDVSFAYAPERPLIEDFSFTAKPGQRIAIVGPTGCGKTTLINLLMRFYDAKSGAILVDGENITDVKRGSLRSKYGMVLQDTWLKAGTVKENIAFGREDASDEEIVAAAKSAHAHSFIKRLKDGYETKLGEDGEGLSQGQKQLICIARVMLTLPPMLILDEATSSIDTRTEIRIQKAFATMMEGRTTFVVAHRLSTVVDSDAIIVMNDGHITEVGTHEELLARGGFYTTLYNSQFAKS
ncbi:MAG: ABC transporter ATP-binding protein [Clostridia bacterium]|nr:ABC transporter ATP-binding protein [Clostridia bacterium]